MYNTVQASGVPRVTDTDEKWWQETYGDSDFGRQYAASRQLDPKLAPTADFLVTAMNLKPGDRVLDQCCGSGPVSLALAQKGIQVIGIDQADHCIEQAKHAAQQRGLGNTFFQSADAFTYKTEQPVDAAINWSTSCGYMRDDEKNIQMFNRAYDSLKPGGRFAVQYMLTSDDHTAWDFAGEPQIINGETVQRRNFLTYDEEHGMSVSQWVNTYPGGRQEQLLPTEMRLYKPEDIKKLLEKAGFEDVKLQEEGDESCRNFIALARKPG